MLDEKKFIIRSYICNPREKIYDLFLLKNNPSRFLIDIDDTSAIAKIKNAIDRDYIEGVIYIQYGNQIVMDYTMWDLVDQLWSYIITAIKQYLVDGASKFYFPDQPLLIELQKKSHTEIGFKVHDQELKEWILPEQSFLIALLKSAQHFFTQLNNLELIDNDNYHYQRKKIDQTYELLPH